MPLPSAADFFAPQAKPDLSQGDIVLAPSLVIWSEESRTPLFFLSSPPNLGDSVVTALWDNYGEVPLAVAETTWGPAMVLSHDCELDKEFNREVERLKSTGMSEEEAVARASENDNLDQLVTVSPVLLYDDIDPELHAAIREAQRIGYFPVPATPIFDDVETVVDLSRLTTVDRRLIRRHKVWASLDDSSVGVLRYKLSEFFAARGLSTLAELEAIVGETIGGVDVVAKNSKATMLLLHLENGDSLHLEIRRPKEGNASAVARILRRF